MIHYLIVFLISMVPLIELRAAIPYGLALAEQFALSPLLIYIVAIIGNCLPVPFILFFIRKILAWMQTSRVGFFRKVATFVVEKGERGFARVQKYATVGLFLFVAIPLPGTGAWTGSLVASMINMPFKKSMLSVFAGVLAAGIIVSAICYGAIDGLAWLIK